MKRLVTFGLISLASSFAGAMVLAFFAVIEAARAYNRSRGVVSGAKITADRRERFNAELQEMEFRVINVGPTIIIDRQEN